jgi:hypothetical protein
VRQFVDPPGAILGDPPLTVEVRPGDPPPRVRFQWGTLIFIGIVTRYDEELDYFATNGTPLRAKVTVSITEQLLAFEDGSAAAGARDASHAAPPGGSPDRSSGTRDVERVVEAQDGDSVQDVLTRTGADPTAWRAAMNGLSSPLALAAGTPVQIGPVGAGAPGVGVSAGFVTGARVTATAELAAVLGGASATGEAAVIAGLALTAGGGVAGAAVRVEAEAAASATARARASFDVPPGRADPRPDPRSTTYGRAVPLRARVGPATQR